MADNLTAVPMQFTSGETVVWTQSEADYPASSWTMTTVFVNAAGKFTVTAVASGDDHVNTISASTSTGLTAGVYKWQQKVTSGQIVHLVSSGTCEVLKNFAAQALTTFDARSHAQKVLEAIEAVIEGRATEDHLSMSIAGRSIAKMSLAELIQARESYRREFAREKKIESLGRDGISKRKIRIRHWV